MAAGFTDEEEKLFNKTGETVLKRLRKTRNPADLLSILRSEHKQFERAYASAPAAARESVACRAGCDACCHVPVGVQAHEVLIAAQHIQMHFSPEALEAVIARAAAHRTTFAGKTNREQTALKSPCVMLTAGNCTIYEARPEACRSHHSHNAAACGMNLDLAREEIDVYVPGVRGRMFAVMLGIDQAVAEAGFDGQAYDFGSALHEALTDGMCAVRWTQRQRAFPDSCREEGSENADGESGLIEAEGFFQ
jgi:Fe-S-cluster containining protein